MKMSITYRLFLAFLAATATLVVCMFLVMNRSFDRGFLRYVAEIEQQHLERLADQLQEAYAVRGSWDFLRDNPATLVRLLAASLPGETLAPDFSAPPGRCPPQRAAKRLESPPRRIRHQLHHLEKRLVLLNAERQSVLDGRPPPAELKLLPLTDQNRTVGYLGLVPPRQLAAPAHLRFVQQQRRSFASIALIMAAAAALLSIPLSRRLVRRITDLATATHQLAAGHYQTRVPASASDELGQLARDFNSLAGSLEQNEKLRRQWVADISHELRTPLAVLRGEIEALQDGVRPQTPESLAMLHGEVMQLSRLVEDLYQLALADIDALSCRRQPIDLRQVLEQSVAAFRGEYEAQGLRLSCEFSSGRSLPMLGDGRRLRQLFGNLLENSLRYSERGGELRIRLTRKGARAFIDFEDSAPGVAEHQLPRLFDRLYRVESSRNRRTGGAGLGLALCKTIVEAHGGAVGAYCSSLGGLGISIELPLQETSP